MRARFPLAAKFAAWLLLNLALLAAGGYALFRAQFHAGFGSFLAGAASTRVEALAESASTQLRSAPRAKWEVILNSLSAARGVNVAVFENAGAHISGPKLVLPDEIKVALKTPMPGEAGLGRRGGPEGPGRRPPGPPDEFGPEDFDEPGGPLPRRGGRDLSRDPRNWPKMLLRTTKPTAYWIIIRAPIDESRPPKPASLILHCASIGAGGLLVETKPLLLAGAAAVVVSVLFWLPFVLGLTRHVRRVTEATARVARGDFEVRVPAGRRDELGVLAASVNTMTGQLDVLVRGQRRFLGDVAHELCSPLARMQAALAILEQRAVDEKQARYAATLREELDEMSRLVDELLQFSKAGVQREIELRAVPLAPLVAEVVAREAAGVGVECDVPGLLAVRAEPKLLARALGNVLRNAVRYAGTAGPIIISTARRNGHVALVVADQGPGVPAESLPRLFDAFYRPDAARTREAGGAGLGLAIVKTCVEACGGTVTARNGDARGLEVALTFTAAE